MATMLAYIATDAACQRPLLQRLLSQGADRSFNRITVDSDTSTNDSCMLTATGRAGVEIGEDDTAFAEALADLMKELAHGIVRDAEGATKFVAVCVNGGKTESDCLAIAYSIANSPLIKTALFASDANWGRIVMAIGKSNAELDISRIDIYLDDVRLQERFG